MDLVMLACAAFLAGLVDAVVGGGGLIQIPVLFSVFPKEVPATLLGTSKFAGIFGTSAAAVNYARRVRVAWSAAAPAAVAAFALSFVGAYTVTRVPADFVRTLLPVVLVAVAVYTFRKKDLGSIHAPIHSGSTERLVAIGMGACIGFYDGFFGPGTGSFLIFLFVRFFGFQCSELFCVERGKQKTFCFNRVLVADSKMSHLFRSLSLLCVRLVKYRSSARSFRITAVFCG